MNHAHSLRSVVDFEFYEFFKLLSLQMDVGRLGACADGSIGTRPASGAGPNSAASGAGSSSAAFCAGASSAAFCATGSSKLRTRSATGPKAITNRPADRNPVRRTCHIEPAENSFEHEDYRRPAVLGADHRG